MKLFFGGAYNGKIKYIKNKFKLNDEDFFYCSDSKIDFSKKVICGIDRLIYYNTLNGKKSLDFFKDNNEKLKDKILICDEISSGIVPISKVDRLWREEVGIVLQFLTKESDMVCRIFFGIPTILKGEK